MKKNIWVFGLISGALITGIANYMAWVCCANPEFETNDFLGYTAMLMIFSLIFIGIRNYRTHYLGGIVTFGQAFKVGFYMSLVASTLYVLVWLVDYYVFIPQYLDQYIVHVMYKAKTNGATETELAETAKSMAEFKEMYKNPLFVIVTTFLEVFPIALVVSLISALILKRKQKDPEAVAV
jgi:hypothetical protein